VLTGFVEGVFGEKRRGTEGWRGHLKLVKFIVGFGVLKKKAYLCHSKE
jgi:hypothetical protein